MRYACLVGYYPSQQKMPLIAENVVAASQPLAAQAGLRINRERRQCDRRCNTAAITLTVVEPTGNGLGSDAFALIWDGQQLHGLNGSGRAPAAWSLNILQNITHIRQSGGILSPRRAQSQPGGRCQAFWQIAIQSAVQTSDILC